MMDNSPSGNPIGANQVHFIFPRNDDSIIATPVNCPGSYARFGIILAVLALEVTTDYPYFAFRRNEGHESSSWRHAGMLKRTILKHFVLCLCGINQVDSLVNS